MKNANLKIFELLSPKYERDNIKLGLSRIKKALQELGNPCKNIPAIQIIGTNGKGSIAAYLESILFEAKRNFGVTTSPHLLDVCERIRVNKKNINKTDFEKIYRLIEKNFSTFELTPFEKIICCALNFFDHQKVELLILEAGLGGRLDATTAHKSRPIIAIGNIGLDHKEFLGDTIEKIAEEKLAVIEKNSIVISCKQNSQVENLLNKKVYDEFNDAIKERDSKGYTSDTTFIGINSSNIKDHEQKNNFLEVTVDFVSEIISSIKDKEKKVISGNPDKIKKVYDTWKFQKDVTTNNPNWLLIDTQV